MNPLRLALATLALTGAVGTGAVLAADRPAMENPFASCTAANPGVMLNTSSHTYVMAILSPTAAGSFPATGSESPNVKAMCESDADAQGGTPAFGGAQMTMNAMMMSVNALDLTPEQRQKLRAMMADASKHDMQRIDAVLTSSQRAQLAAAMRQMAFPGP